MKSKKLVASFIAAAVVVGAFYFTPSDASQSTDQQAKQAVTHYLNSAKSGNVAEMMKYTKDVRYKDDASKQKAYERMVKDPMKKAELLNLEVVSDTAAKATVRWTTKETGTHELTLPVVKDGDQWKVFVDRSQTVEKNDIQ